MATPRRWSVLAVAVVVLAGPVLLAAPAQAAACNPSSAIDGSFTVLTFTNSSSCSWTVPTGVTSAEVLVVAGGGGGAGSLTSSAGGGAGGLSSSTGVVLVPAATVAVVAGGGGSGNTSGGNGSPGSDSTFGSTTTTGGGGGGGNGANGQSGGSGGGAGFAVLTSRTGGTRTTAGQGFNGGDSPSSGVALLGGGGGGGAGGAGNNGGLLAASAGLPGAGAAKSVTGSAGTYAAGGASVATSQDPGAAAAGLATPPVGGGGRACILAAAGAGNAGVVIVRFSTPPTAPVFTASTPTGPATVGTAYSYTYLATGPPAPTFALASGSLPPGVTLSSAGVLSGTPTAAGTYTWTVTATNSAGSTTTATQSLLVQSAPAFTAASPPASGTTGSAYSYTFTASGLPAPTFAVASGSLPPGLALSSAGVLSGTPTLLGSYTFTVSASNSVSSATTGSLSITVAAAPVPPTFVLVTPPTTGAVGTPYAGYTFTASGSPAPTYTLATGTLPAGLSLSSGGVLSGTPTSAGSSSFTVRASNAGGSDTTGTITIAISPAAAAPAFVNQSPPTSATALTAYAGYTFTASGYPAPTFTVGSGLLPTGISLNATTGALSGTPLVAGSYPLTLTATNASGSASTSAFTITVAPTPVAPVLVLASPPATATAGTAYAGYTFTALGVPAPTFAVSSGALPAGIALTSAGTLAGTPTTAGTATFAVTATNSAGSDSTATLTIAVAPTPVAPAFTAASPPVTGTVGTAYPSYQFTASGVPAPTFAVTSGLLPVGLSLSAAGLLTGTPTLPGTSTFAVTATNSAGSASTATLTITVAAAPVAPVFVLASPPAGATVGTPYAGYTFTAAGVPAPSFAVSSGSLPAGLTLSSAGALSGTPTTAGAATFVVSASNSAGSATTSTLTIAVDQAPVAPTFTAAAPPASATFGTAYSYAFSALGIPAPTFAVATGTLPLGLSLSSAGVLSGTPILTGSSNFTVSASNSAGTASTGPLSITVNPAPVGPLFLTASPPATGTVGTAYPAYSFTALGVPAPVFSLASGALPDGLGLTSAGVLSGTPTTAGTATFTVSATNSTGTTSTGPLTIAVAPTPVPPTFTAAGPPATATAGSAYPAYTFTATGVPAPSFAVASGLLPLGLSLSGAGVLSGTPTLPGSSTFTVSASNSAGSTSTSSLTITVAPTPIAPVFTAASPPATGTAGTGYGPYTFTAFAVPAATFAVSSGALPAGLALSSAGVLSGTPTAAGSATFAVTASNAAGSAVTGPLTVTVAPAPVPPTFTAASPPGTATAGTAYPAYTFTASGQPAASFAVGSGALPLGLTLDGATGVLSGTPLLPGSSTFTVSATNSAGTASTPALTVTVVPTPVAPVLVAASPPATGTAGTPYAGYTFTAVGVPAPTFSVGSGALPAGLTLTSGGVLAGTPVTPGAYPFTVLAGNAAGSTSSSALTITIAPTPVAPGFTAASPPATATAGTAYPTYTFAATGQPGPTFAVDSGALPAGLSLSSAGVLSGTPLLAGSSTFTVSATNSSGAVSTPARTIVVNPVTTAPVLVNQTPPGTGTVGTPYSYTYTATGYPAPTFAVDTGTLPAGLSLSSAGVLSGTPTAPGSSSFTVQATNAGGSASTPLAATVAISPAAAGPAFVDQSPPTVGTVGAGYSYAFTATGYPAPTFAVASGSLPLGLTLSSAGLLSGTPLAAGSSSFTVSASNAGGAVSTGSKTIAISPTSVPPAFVGITAPPDATVGMPYLNQFTVVGYPAATFSTADPLPPGLSLSGAGLLSGTPASGSDGAYPITVTATNGTAPDASTSVTLTVQPAPSGAVAPAFIGLDPPSGTVGTAYSYPFTATGYPAPTFSTADPLPAGLSLNASGLLSGTPTAAGSTTFTVTAANGTTNANRTVTVSVDPASMAPSFTAAAPPDATVGSFYTYTFTAIGQPATMAFTTADPLPLGLVLLPGGQLTGQPQAGSQGSYPVTVTATNGTAPAATASFTLRVDPAPAPPAFTSAAPPTGTVGAAYSHTFTASGQPAAMTFGTTDPLPAGLALSAGGVLSGTPAPGSEGTSSVTVTASNGVNPDATSTVTLTVDPAPQAPVFTAASPGPATAGQPYSYTFTATGYPAPTFATADALPVGLRLSAAGALTGPPAAGAAGTHTFTVTAGNGVTPDASQLVTLHVGAAAAAPAFTAADPPAATVGVAYSGYTFTASGNPAPTFSADADIPAGLTLSAAGLLSGTPTAAGNHPFVVTATNGVNPDATATVRVVVGTVPAFTAQSPPLTGSTGTPYSYTFAATGYPAVTYATTSQLPLGWSLDASTGQLSAALPVVGSFTVSVTASNSSGTATAGPFSIAIGLQPITPAMTDGGTEARTATVGSAYPTYQFTASGVPAPTFSVSAGSLPPGLALSSGGTLSGTPTQAGIYPFTVRADNGVNPAATRATQIVVDQAPAFTAASPPLTGTAGTAYSYAFAASGAPAPVFATFAALPAGWNLDPATGALTATSPAAGTFSVAVSATNRAGTDAAGPFTITVDPAPAVPALTAASPPATGVVGAGYGPYQFAATGYPAPTFAPASGSLPAGLSLDPATGVLAGTPSAAGSATFTVRAHNAAGDDTSAPITIAVAAAAAVPQFGATNAPSTGTAGTAYAGFTFTAAGNPAPAFTIADGALPAGMVLDQVTGQLSGTPTEGGTFTFKVRATNTAGAAATGPITLTVTGPPVLVAAAPPSAAVTGNQYGPYRFTASGYPAPTFALASGALPAGLALDPVTGALSGIPTAAGESTFRISAANTAGTVTSGAITVTVTLPPPVPLPPAFVRLTPGTASLIASWSPVAGALSYAVSASPGSAGCVTTGTSCVLGGVAGTTYTVTVVAQGAVANSAVSASSNPATPAAPALPATAPAGAPPTLTTDRGQIQIARAGEAITVIGTGFAPFSTAIVAVYSTPTKLADVTTDADGAFRAPTVLPQLAPGGHALVASGVDPDGSTRMIRLPFTIVPASATDEGGATTVAFPRKARITLLDADGNEATAVRVAQGVYRLDQRTGRISFRPPGGFVGTADPVSYRITDTLGTVITGSYAAVVRTPTGRPELPLPDRVLSSVGDYAAAPVTCRLVPGPVVDCAVTATARVEGRTVMVGRGVRTTSAVRNLDDLEVPVLLTARGQALAGRPGGVKVTFSAVLTQAGHAVTTTVAGTSTVLAERYTLARPINFGARSATIGAVPRGYLTAVRARLGGARQVTCVGNAQTRGGDAFTRALALRRARAACAILARGLPVTVRTAARIHRPPTGAGDIEAARARNRRVAIIIAN